MKLLSISSDRKIFDKNSAVAKRQIEYASNCEEMHIVVFTEKNGGKNNESEYKEISLAPNLWIYPTRSISRWFYIMDALRLSHFIVTRRKISHITCQDPFETGLVGVLVKNRHKYKYGVQLELQIHTDIGSKYFINFNFLNKIRTFISKFTLPRADHIRVVSSRIKDYVKKYIDESKIEIRPIKVDINKIKDAPINVDLHMKYPQFRKIIVVASRLEKEKNIEMAINAFSLVLKRTPGIGLVIIGEGSERNNLENLAMSKGLDKSVVFLGWQDNMSTYYKTCDIFLLTSWYEGYGMTLLEANACGAKIVSTDVGIAKEIGATIVDFNDESVSKAILDNL